LEEVEEFNNAENEKELKEELADIFEVINAISKIY
jgi:predicted house-cleaning noncanonical NTP pyrophosphatase (MazG superfamily)